jgi:transcriptional regulator with XRE-family HTH domain
MSPGDVKAIRKALGCSARDLGAALDVPSETILAWERGDLFPTKAHVERLNALREKGPAAFKGKGRERSPLQLLADPEIWSLFRKLLANRELRAEVLKLAAKVPDPDE